MQSPLPLVFSYASLPLAILIFFLYTLSHFSRLSLLPVFDRLCNDLQRQGMTETFDAMTLVYLAELLYGDGHIHTSGETIDNQSSDQLPLHEALEAFKREEREAENATSSKIPRATPRTHRQHNPSCRQ